MSWYGIEFREGTASDEDIRIHLERCDTDFSPRLSFKVDIGEYSRKIKTHARTFEAWSNEKLVGLVAAYMNDSVTRIGFVTSVSVTKEFRGRGIASMLLSRCLSRSRWHGMTALRLEVDRESDATHIYQNLGFAIVERKGDTVAMELKIGQKRQS